MIEFKEQNLLGGWSIEVLNNRMLIGHIRKHGQDNTFLYYSGPHNKLNWSLQDGNLQVLKKKIEASLT
jgi:hypothetical protein